MIKKINEYSEVLDFAWELCQDKTKASYSKFDTKEYLKSKLIRGINSEDRQVIGYYENDDLIGVCMFHWIDEDKYAQTEALLIKDNYNLAADEIINFIKVKLKGYKLLIGITADNKEAIDYFKEREAICIDASFDTRLKKRNFKPQDIKHKISKLEFEGFNEYAEFHDKYAQNMYWNSKNLREAFNNFITFIYRDELGIRGSIFTKTVNETDGEIFGVFIDDAEKEKGIVGDLIGTTLKFVYEEYKNMDEIAYFMDENSKEEIDYAMKYGFEINDRYRLYEMEL